jgi:hypothetical protein
MYDTSCFSSSAYTRAARKHIFVAKSPGEKDTWIKAFVENKKRHEKRFLKNKEHYGWLRIKRGKPFFFVLTKGRLSWYRSQEDREEKGSVLMDDCTFRRETNELRTFTIFGAGGGAYDTSFCCHVAC